ncbi:transposase, partial [Escherichia coli]|uniref:transposase n=1 Tax=Escherichia coli TaxID=562 RepID=UPI001177F238
MSKRTRRTFSQEFKQQIVNLYLAGKPRVEIIREYELTASAFDKWVKQSKTSGSFKEKDNLTPEQKGEILGYSCGEHKDAVLVKKAFSRIKQPLTEVEIFHTDRGKEFDNQAIDELLTTFDINRSLSHKGCPFDNAVAESTYKSLKVEF